MNATRPKKPGRKPYPRTINSPPTLTPEDLEAAMADVFGSWGWQRRLAGGTGLAVSTVQRYVKGELAIPAYLAVIVEMLQTLRHNNLPLPDSFQVE